MFRASFVLVLALPRVFVASRDASMNRDCGTIGSQSACYRSAAVHSIDSFIEYSEPLLRRLLPSSFAAMFSRSSQFASAMRRTLHTHAAKSQFTITFTSAQQMRQQAASSSSVLSPSSFSALLGMTAAPSVSALATTTTGGTRTLTTQTAARRPAAGTNIALMLVNTGQKRERTSSEFCAVLFSLAVLLSLLLIFSLCQAMMIRKFLTLARSLACTRSLARRSSLDGSLSHSTCE